MKTTTGIRFPWAAAIPVAWVAALGGCEQAPVPCLIAQQHFASTYTVMNPGATGTCKLVEAEGVAAAYHLGKGGEFGPGDPENAGMSLVAAHVAHLYTDAQESAGFVQRSKYSAHYGKFAKDYPDENDICRPANFSGVAFNIPQIEDDPETEEDEFAPADDVRATWRGVKVSVTPDAPGTYFTGEMTVERNCGTVVYGVRAFTPVLGCVEDDECAITQEIDPTWKSHCERNVHISWMTGAWELVGTCILD